MSLRELIEERVGSELAAALEGRGFESLTPVQEAVLKPELVGRDLRISSQTGSGKTVAIGLAIRASLDAPEDDSESDGNAKGVDQRARPRAVVVVPTRELAKQVQEELSWLYAGMKDVRIAAVTGGGGYRDELRAFRQKPAIIVGTPGRLLDHLKRGAIDTTHANTFALDEADRMLDLGFREDIEAIFGFAPEGRRTLLVSATFPREVKSLADRIQKDWVAVEGTPLGGANEDIEHLLHLVHQEERLAAIINLLLEADGQTLIFARTRADVAELTGLLQDAGFSISSLSGEMEQAERNRALAAFKRGNIDALVATDVAARGIDVNDVTRVIHAEPPTDADAYTHRSGRTGRAGKKGVSSVLVTPREIQRTTALLGRARVRFRFAPLPTAESLRDARDTALFERLTANFVEGDTIDDRSLALAERIIHSTEPARAVGRLVSYSLRQQTEARELTVLTPPEERKRDRERAPTRDGWVRFRVSWGTVYGAVHGRLMAMLCRRGKIEGRDIGAINLGRTSSVVEISASVADAFERASAKPDPRDPRIHIRRWSDEPTGRDDDAPPPAPPRPPPPPPKSKREVEEAPPPPKSKRELTEDRPSRAAKKSERELFAAAPDSATELPEDRPSRAAKKSERELPADRPSRAAKKSERDLADSAPESERELPEDRPSRAAPPSAPKSKRALPEDRPSRAAKKSDRELAASAPKSERELPEDRPSRAAKKSDRDVSKRTLPAAAESAPDTDREAPAAPASSTDAAPKKKKKKAKEEEPAFAPREAVIRRDKPAARADDRGPAPRGNRDDRGPAPRGDRPWNDRGPGPDRGPPPRGDRPNRPWNDRGPPRDDRGPAPRGDRPTKPWNDRGPRDDRGPAPGDRGAPRNDRGPAPNDRGGKPPWKKSGPPQGGTGGPRRDGPPPPWKRREGGGGPGGGAGSGPPKRRSGPR